jgi:hypothetical protein
MPRCSSTAPRNCSPSPVRQPSAHLPSAREGDATVPVEVGWLCGRAVSRKITRCGDRHKGIGGKTARGQGRVGEVAMTNGKIDPVLDQIDASISTRITIRKTSADAALHTAAQKTGAIAKRIRPDRPPVLSRSKASRAAKSSVGRTAPSWKIYPASVTAMLRELLSRSWAPSFASGAAICLPPID